MKYWFAFFAALSLASMAYPCDKHPGLEHEEYVKSLPSWQKAGGGGGGFSKAAIESGARDELRSSGGAGSTSLDSDGFFDSVGRAKPEIQRDIDGAEINNSRPRQVQ